MSARRVSVTAISIAIVTVMVSVVKIPIPATGGFWHLGVIAEAFLAVAFGPAIGAVSAGVGAALADLFGGFGSFAPLTLLAHGATGLIIGLLAWKKGLIGMIFGLIVGGAAQVAIYFFGEATVYGFGLPGAIGELSLNLIQVGFGFFGLVLFGVVKYVYPRIEDLAEDPTFEEV
ncbi:MAG: ECF transporter S component [Anaerolineales bacterium]